MQSVCTVCNLGNEHSRFTLIFIIEPFHKLMPVVPTVTMQDIIITYSGTQFQKLCINSYETKLEYRNSGVKLILEWSD